MRNILDICQEVADLAAISRPLDLFNDNSQNDQTFLSIAKTALRDLRSYGDWQSLVKDGQLQTVEGKSTYLIKDFCEDFFCLVSGTVIIKDQAEQVIGSISYEQWQKEKYFNVPSINLHFNIQNNCFRFSSVPPAGIKIVFKYRSGYLAFDPTDKYCPNAPKITITKNTDVPIFDDYLVELNVYYRLLKRNGMSYEEEFNEYQRAVKSRFGMEIASADIRLDGRYETDCLGGVVLNATKGS